MAVDLASLIVDVPDFPRPGIGFRDITPLLASPSGLAAAVTGLVESAPDDIDVVVGLEARGFIFGPSVALALGALQADPQAAVTMGIAARQRMVDSFSAEVHLQRLFELYEEAARARRQH